MNKKSAKKLTEREIMEEALKTEKEMTAEYNRRTLECSGSSIKNTFLSILDDEHEMCSWVLDEMDARGWHRAESAEQPEIFKTKQKYSVSENEE